jgi:hypothetical protein
VDAVLAALRQFAAGGEAGAPGLLQALTTLKARAGLARAHAAAFG